MTASLALKAGILAASSSMVLTPASRRLFWVSSVGSTVIWRGTVFAGNFEGSGTDRDGADHGRVGRDRCDPRAAFLDDLLDIGGRNVGRVDLQLVGNAEIGRRQLHAPGEFVIGRKNHGNIGIGPQRGLCLIGGAGRCRVADIAEACLLDDTLVLRLERVPDLVAAIERRKAGDIDVAGIEAGAVVLDRLLQRLLCQRMVALLDLRHLRIVEIDVEGDDLDALVERLLHDIAERFGHAMIDNDAFDAEIDRLQDLLALFRRVLAAGEDPQIDTKRLRLCLGAGLIGLEEIASRNVADQRQLDAALVERGRCAGDAIGLGSRDEQEGNESGGCRQTENGFHGMRSF